MIQGREIAQHLKRALKAKITRLDIKPCLATILIGHDQGSALYVKMKNRACAKVGIVTQNFHLPNQCPAEKLHALILKLNVDNRVNGILIEKPYHIVGATETEVDDWISPDKDVDGTNAQNIARLYRNEAGLRPCTAQGVIQLLKSNGIRDFSGKSVAIINRSEIIGRPLALMFIHLNAEVSIFNHFLKPESLRMGNYQIVIAATGHGDLFKASQVTSQQVLVPISEVRGNDGKLHGDFSLPALKKAKLGFSCTGNCGPLTIYFLMHGVYQAYLRQH